jgi:hypothetical protein
MPDGHSGKRQFGCCNTGYFGASLFWAFGAGAACD